MNCAPRSCRQSSKTGNRTLKRPGGVASEELAVKICNLLSRNEHLSSALFIGGYRSYLSERAKLGGVFLLSTFHLLHVFAHVARITSRLRDLNSPDCAVFNRCPPTLTVRKPGDWLAARRRSRRPLFWRSLSGSCRNGTERAKL